MKIDISDMQTVEHDVLVIGAGGAGLRAAIECSNRGLRTAVISKSMLGKAHTVMAEGGCAAALGNVDPRDNWRVHFRDTMRGGKFMNNWRMAELHAREAPDRVRELEEWGAIFDRTKDGLISQRNFGGHRYPRLAHVGDRTGLEMIRTLQDHGVHRGIDFYMECKALSLLQDDNRICGAVGLWRESGRFVTFRAGAVIMATGGGGRAWSVTSNSWEYTGDGITMAYDAGAALMDLEFTQFHPTGMVWPPSVRGILVTESVRGDGGILQNREGERFMFRYIPDRFASETADSEAEADRWLAGEKGARRPPELLTRDVVARAILNEVKEGRGSPHGGAFLDIASRRPAEVIRRKLPSMYHQFKELAGVDITKERMEVGPTLHYFMGGICVDAESQQTNVAGLFACGECAAGLHGANRLGGNSLSDLLVFGRLAGRAASEYVQGNAQAPAPNPAEVESVVQRAVDVLNRESGENPYLIHEALQDLMQEDVGIIRSAEQLEKGIEGIRRLRERARRVRASGASQYNPGWHEALDLHSLLRMSEAVGRAALVREESRGAHTRIDFEGEDEAWGRRSVVIAREDGEMTVRVVERETPPEELASIAYATIEELENMYG
jgi:succinate dehydrogenase / fumarate reductase flavoprotein subunit